MGKDGKNGKYGNNANDGKQGEDSSHPSHNSHPILPPRGDYQALLSFQKAEVVYDLTFRFAHKHLSKGDRTLDQMIQAARSGKKNILEGSKAALTSKETEIKLTNVARASLEELLDDYRDYLRLIMPNADCRMMTAKCKGKKNGFRWRAGVRLSRPLSVHSHFSPIIRQSAVGIRQFR
jgi:four helix bundle protein